MRFILSLCALCLAAPAHAQMRDSVFADYNDYAAFVDAKIMEREFPELVLTLGGRDEYTKEQLASVNTNLMAAFPYDFRSRTVFRQEDLGGGVMQEARAYWTGESYAFFYAIMHDRGDELVVINFNLNSNIGAILGKF